MVLSSIEVCMDSSDWSQSVMHERALKPLDDSILPACSRPMMEQTGLKPPPPPPQPEQGLKCPRCDSSHTKFCYYNNYSLSQPRHFCKTCKRYWTRGGTLRNVPVGGGCRKNKRVKRTVDQSGPSSLQMSEAGAAAASTSIGGASHGLNTNGSLIPNFIFSGLSNSGVTGDGFHNVAIQRALPNINGCEFLRTSFDFQSNLSALSSLNALSALNSLNSFRPNFNLNPSRIEHGTLVGDLSNTFFESFPQQISEAQPLALLNPANSDGLSPYGLSLDGMNCNDSNKRPEGTQWRSTEQQLQVAETSDVDAGLVAYTDLENLNHSRHENLKAVTSLPASCVKLEDQDNRLTTAPEWALTSPSESNLFETGGDSAYWNGATWTDLASYGSSASPLI